MPNPAFNVPNQITAVRFILSVVMFVLMPFELYTASLIIFIVAASTDWVDGWWARRYQQVTQLGRIFDPFVDKIIISGAYIYLVAKYPQSGIAPWMAVIVVGRELLITVIRSYLEQRGRDFSANMAGKVKFVFQCAAVVASLLALRHLQVHGEPLPAWLAWSVFAAAWLAVLSTIYSGAGYIVVAAKLLGEKS